MTDAVRSATPPNPALLHLDQQVMAYLAGRVDLDAIVALCVATLGPRPALSITLARQDATVDGRLRALDAALAEVRARTG